jgi:negative regulator of flagellin synthesis FlgM
MVDPIGIKAGAVADRRPVSVDAPAAPAAVQAPKPVSNQPKAVETAAAQISRSMAAEAPVDAERVARIKKAIEDGRFPLVPSTIADRLLALKMQWKPE